MFDFYIPHFLKNLKCCINSCSIRNTSEIHNIYYSWVVYIQGYGKIKIYRLIRIINKLNKINNNNNNNNNTKKNTLKKKKKYTFITLLSKTPMLLNL